MNTFFVNHHNRETDHHDQGSFKDLIRLNSYGNPPHNEKRTQDP